MTRGVVLLTLTLLLGTIGFLLGAGSIGLSATRMGATVNLRKTKLASALRAKIKAPAGMRFRPGRE